MRDRIHKIAVLAMAGLGTFLVVILLGMWWRGYFS